MDGNIFSVNLLKNDFVSAVVSLILVQWTQAFRSILVCMNRIGTHFGFRYLAKHFFLFRRIQLSFSFCYSILLTWPIEWRNFANDHSLSFCRWLMLIFFLKVFIFIETDKMIFKRIILDRSYRSAPLKSFISLRAFWRPSWPKEDFIISCCFMRVASSWNFVIYKF